MSYEDRIIPLLRYLRTDFRSPRSVTYRTSEPEYVPENENAAIAEFKRILKPIWHLILIGILTGILVWVFLIVLLEWNTKQNVLTSLAHVKKERKTNTEKLLEEIRRMVEQLKLTKTNFSILKAEYDRLLHNLPCNATFLEHELNSLSAVLDKALKAKAQIEGQANRVAAQLKSVQDKYRPVELKNQRQRSILSSKRLSYIWDFCNRTTLTCSHCRPGWTEHASRCFLISKVDKNWESARVDCRKYRGDLAIVLNKTDQEFLTNMALQFKNKNPRMTSHSLWIGLQDMVKEGVHFWVDGERVKWDVAYWKFGAPNSTEFALNTEHETEDCVAIAPPDQVGPEGWLDTWYEADCTERHHYICQGDALIKP
ncbi:low affinity immunoglobulin epsilon Fc receptor-like [Poeciliopsis prolifica]|uniref:low affinity immunoglobulin epsilon Fc receptor-like n=1 Tax=Poeciliopsis prolifica TaxID=188132 RepID=UPI0024142FF6|nr:low affinity immunoglobulin epsilon Fc receptor-like [Poeciliopsis prolifica]